MIDCWEFVVIVGFGKIIAIENRIAIYYAGLIKPHKEVRVGTVHFVLKQGLQQTETLAAANEASSLAAVLSCF